jgi:hypothetical protein
MTLSLFIDPGVAGRGCACAAFDDAYLIGAWFERVVTFKPHQVLPAATPVGAGFSFVAVERPVVQGERTARADPGDLMDLSWEGALLAGSYAGRDECPIVCLPSTNSTGRRCPRHSARVKAADRGGACTCQKGWKGSEPKPQMHARAWERLEPAEKKMLGGRATERTIMAAREKGALSRWAKPGVAYYPKAFDTHNLLDALCMGLWYFGRLKGERFE